MATGKNSHLEFKDCPACRGTGKVKCPDCGGKGKPYDCQTCWGISSEPGDGRRLPCARCQGKGYVART